MRYFILMFLLAFSARGDWYRNPLAFKAVDKGFELRERISGFAVREELPLSRAVTVEGSFELTDRPASNSWWIAGVSVMNDEKNFWHLALVQAPADHGGRYSFELSEMLDGRWLAQNGLKVAETQQAKDIKFGNGSRWHMKIAMDEDGITGEIKDSTGRGVFRRRYLFSGKAVTCGRPAIHTTGLSGVFADLKFSSGNPVPEKEAAENFPPYKSDNYVKQIKSKATGYFYVKQFSDGRWWAIDPLGRGVVVLGVDHITYWGHWCSKLGYHPHRRKNEKKYPDPAVWEEETLSRLKSWGFSMLGAGSQHSLERRGLYHCISLGMGQEFTGCGEEFYITPNEGRPCSAFPNVFHPDFEMFCRYKARSRCSSYANDPWLFGWFIDNELAWWGRGKLESGLFDAAMKLGSVHTAKQALVEFVKERSGSDISKFNAFWKTEYKNFSELKSAVALSSSTDGQIQVKNDFLRLAAERYFSITTKAIREIDPNHMIMGARFAGTGGADPEVWKVSGKYCDVVTFNCYPTADLDKNVVVYSSRGEGAEPVAQHFARYYDYVKKPMLITEWSFPALDAGLPSVHGAGQRFLTQQGRTAATKLFAQTMLSLPYLIGYDYFMWVDEPALGITEAFPEDSNYGLVNEDCIPYKEITGMFTALHADLYNQRTTPVPAARKDVHKRVLAPMESALKIKALNADAPPPVVQRKGKSFVLDNGRLKLEGAIGPGRFIKNISLDGKPYGSYNALVHFSDRNGRNQWKDVGEVTGVDTRMENGCAVIDIRGIYKAEPSFEVAHCIIVPPASTKFICQLLWVRNTAESDLSVKGLYFRFYGADRNWGESKAPPRLWGVPKYGCWMQPDSGDYYGVLASSLISGVQIYFWQDQTYKSFHPDARYEVEKVLKPGEIFTPGKYVTLMGVLGTGGKDGWMNEMKAGSALLETAY